MITFGKTGAGITALSIFMTGSAAFADVSPRQVWDDWKGYMTGFGYDVQGSESAAGGTLTVTDITMSIPLPEGAGRVSLAVPELGFADNGDGTVSVQVPPVLPMAIDVESPDSEDVSMTIDYLTDGFSMVVAGDDSNLSYDYAAASLTVALKNLIVEGETAEVGTAEMQVTDLAGTTTMTLGDLRVADQNMTTGPVTYTIDFEDPEGGEGRMVMNGGIDSLGFAGTGRFPMDMNVSDMAAMLAAGFAFDSKFTWSGGASSFNFQESGDTVQGSSKTEKGAFSVAMDESQLMYAGSASNMQLQMMGGDIPFPVELALAESGFSLKMPISKSDEAQDYALSLTLGDFTMSDMIWGMFDPAGQLPRDPATIALDLSGKARMFFDLMDPDQIESLDGGEMMPGELNAVSLNNLTVRAAGAELTGSGGFTFDNADLQTFGGVPAPDGAVDLKLVGGNGLLDKLVAMGLLPEEQAQGARMMMGLFAVPSGDDTLTSKIEVKPDGQILANGQRLQ